MSLIVFEPKKFLIISLFENGTERNGWHCDNDTDYAFNCTKNTSSRYFSFNCHLPTYISEAICTLT